VLIMNARSVVVHIVVTLVAWWSAPCGADPAQTPAATSPGGVGTLAESRVVCIRSADPEAIDACTNLIQSDKSSKDEIAHAEMLRGLAYRRQGKIELAIADLTDSIEISTTLTDRRALYNEYINRGRTYEGEGQHQSALSDFNKAIEIDPTVYAGYQGLGSVHQNIGAHDLAVTDYTHAIAIQSDFDALYIYRANSYQSLGSQDRAISDYTKAIAVISANASPTLQGDLATAYNGRAWSYHLEKQDAVGLADAEKAVALAPHDPEAVETRAEIYERLGRKGQAIAGYRDALKLQPDIAGAEAGLRRLGAEP